LSVEPEGKGKATHYGGIFDRQPIYLDFYAR